MANEELVEYQSQKEEFENSLAQVATATMMAQSLSFCLERKYLITNNNNYFHLVKRNGSKPSKSFLNIRWIKITQVGRPINDNLGACFDAMQNILQACSLPRTRLLFLIIGNGKEFSLMMGLNGSDNDIVDFQSDTSDFINISWTGVSCKPVSENSEEFKEIKNYLETPYISVNAITGIPTLDMQNNYPGTMEYIMGGMRRDKMAYLVVAEPVVEDEINNALFVCREMQGQAESVKTFSFAESLQRGTTQSITNAHSITQSESEAIGESCKDRKAIVKSLLAGGALIAAGLAFPPIAPFVGIAEFLAAPITNGGMGGIGVISAMIPVKSKTKTTSQGITDTTAESSGTSESYSKSLTKNLVNSHVESIVEQLKIHAKRLEQGKAIGMWNVGCYLFSSSGSQFSPMQLKSILSGKDSIYEPIRIHDISQFCNSTSRHRSDGFLLPPIIETLITAPNKPATVISHPFGNSYSRLTTTLTTKELSCFINFPLHSVPGVNVVESTPDFALAEQKQNDTTRLIDLGKLMWSGSSTDVTVRLPIDTLSRHSLVSGVNGSGKTNTVLSILSGLLKEHLPFMVIEPAKTEYVDWAIDYNKSVTDPHKKIKIFMPGCSRYAKKNYTPDILRINPFEVIDLGNNEPRVLTHIDRLKATFAAAFPMQDILPVVLEHLLYDLYRPILMQDMTDPLYRRRKFPRLSQIDNDFIKQLMLNLGYAQENTQNISAALRTRFESLKFGWKGEMLNNDKLAGQTWSELFGTPCIINLSYAGDDQDRAFIMSIILQFLYEYRVAESEGALYSFNDNVCRHLVVVEEAHRVMGRCENPELPQYKSGQMFSNFLSEVRAYGQGMMIVDQVPTRLIDDAIKNTNIKIIHKLVASDDSQKISECIGLTSEQQKVIPRLSIGQAVLAGFNSADVMSINSADIYLAQIKKMK